MNSIRVESVFNSNRATHNSIAAFISLLTRSDCVATFCVVRIVDVVVIVEHCKSILMSSRTKASTQANKSIKNVLNMISNMFMCNMKSNEKKEEKQNECKVYYMLVCRTFANNTT